MENIFISCYKRVTIIIRFAQGVSKWGYSFARVLRLLN